MPPTAATVASLGVLTNACFWLAFLNAHLAILNALPVWILDGGHVLAAAIERVEAWAAVDVSGRSRRLVVHGTGLLSALFVLVAVFGPWL